MFIIWGGELTCYRHTDIQTNRHTDRPSDEAGPRGAFAPKNNLRNKIVQLNSCWLHSRSWNTTWLLKLRNKLKHVLTITFRTRFGASRERLCPPPPKKGPKLSIEKIKTKFELFIFLVDQKYRKSVKKSSWTKKNSKKINLSRNRLCMISDPSDITMDHHANFEVNNHMSTYKNTGVYIICEIHIFAPPPFLIHIFAPAEIYHNEKVLAAGEKL